MFSGNFYPALLHDLKVTWNLHLSKVPSLNLLEDKARFRNTLGNHQSKTVTLNDN